MKTKNRIVGGVILIIVAVAFLVGYWPEHRRRTALEVDNASLRTQVTGLEDGVRLSRLHARLLELIDVVTAMNYGEAERLSSPSFDDIRTEADRTHDCQYRDALQEVLGRRDSITGALAKGIRLRSNRSAKPKGACDRCSPLRVRSPSESRREILEGQYATGIVFCTLRG